MIYTIRSRSMWTIVTIYRKAVVEDWHWEINKENILEINWRRFKLVQVEALKTPWINWLTTNVFDLFKSIEEWSNEEVYIKTPR